MLQNRAAVCFFKFEFYLTVECLDSLAEYSFYLRKGANQPAKRSHYSELLNKSGGFILKPKNFADFIYQPEFIFKPFVF